MHFPARIIPDLKRRKYAFQQHKNENQSAYNADSAVYFNRFFVIFLFNQIKYPGNQNRQTYYNTYNIKNHFLKCEWRRPPRKRICTL